LIRIITTSVNTTLHKFVSPYDRFGVFSAMKIQVVVFWVMTPCSDVVSLYLFPIGL